MERLEHVDTFLTSLKHSIEAFKRTSQCAGLTWDQKLMLERAHIQLGGKPINKNCSSCLARAMELTIYHAEKYTLNKP